MLEILKSTEAGYDNKQITEGKVIEESELLFFKMIEWFYTTYEINDFDRNYTIRELVEKCSFSSAIRNHLTNLEGVNNIYEDDDTKELTEPFLIYNHLISQINEIITAIVLFKKLKINYVPNYLLIKLAAFMSMIKKYQFDIDLDTIIDKQFKYDVANILLGDYSENANSKLKEDVKRKLHRYEIILEEYINSLNNKQK